MRVYCRSKAGQATRPAGGVFARDLIVIDNAAAPDAGL
jgi:hypothetical protein